jgi:hypothetical protein
LLAVTFAIADGELRVFSDNGETVTLEHSGTNTVVNGASFADSAISTGVSIHVGSFLGPGLNTVNIRSTLKPVTVDSPGRLDFINIGGAANGAQGILAPVDVEGFALGANVVVDDSGNISSRNVQLDNVNDVNIVTGLAPAGITFADTQLDFLGINGGSGGNTFTIANSPIHHGFFDLRNVRASLKSGTGKDTVNVVGTSSFLFEIEGQGGGDTVNVGRQGNLQVVSGLLRVSDAGASTILVLNDSSSTVPKNVTINHTDSIGNTEPDLLFIRGLTSGFIEYNVHGVKGLDVRGGGGGNTFTIDDIGNTSLFSGTGKDHVFVRNTSGPLNVLGQAGADVVDVGDGNNSQGIRGALFISNTASRSVVNLHNSADPGGRAVTLDADAVTGLDTVTGLTPARISFRAADVVTLGISTGGAVDSYFVQGTLGPTTSIHAGGGDDHFFVGGSSSTIDTIRAPVSLDGEGGADTLSIFDFGSTRPHTYTVTDTSVKRSSTLDPTVTINFMSMSSVKLFKGAVINPSPPLAKNLTLRDEVRVGKPITLSGRLVDGDKADKIALVVDWGDGSAPVRVSPNRRPFRLEHVYAQEGPVTVRVIWTDSSGESNFRQATVFVVKASARVSSGKAIWS